MSVGAALFWGGATSASLFIGEALSVPLEKRDDITGLIMGFGAGTLLSAVAYELVPQSSLSHASGIGIAFLLGAATYFVADRVIDRAGGADRQDIGGVEAASGSGVAMFLGALLDGIPEAFAGGAVLTMLADSMMPEAFENGGRLVGLVTVLGYLLTAVLSVAT